MTPGETPGPARSLAKALRSLLRGGISDATPATERKYLLLSNTLALLSLLLTGAHLPFTALVWQPELFLPLGVMLSGCVGYVLVLILIRAGRTMTGRILLHIVSPVMIGTTALLLGPVIGSQWYLVFVFVAALFTFSPAHNLLRFSLMAVAAAALLWLEIHFQTAGPLVELPLAAQQLLGIVVRVGFVLGLVAFLGYVNHNYERSELNLAEERARSDRLLLNILPESIAARLRTEQGTIATAHEAASVLFADIVGFTPLSERLPPQELVRRLNALFSRFDDLVSDFGVEKIKMIGDAYMVAAGVPHARDDHAIVLARFALAMRAVAREADEFDSDLALRIGIHSGPVVAGVIGRSRFIYDLWGDTVNTAARMESHGLPGEIQVTRAAYEYLLHDFRLESRGFVEVKGKGNMEVFLLKGEKR